ncbi:hypothetical protein CWB41_15985 [Methylovirgula ligni]|uniref:Uncharacterized protein n=1 Tax=Methylovirgula ligni TaxID=569860 RepID=A0A3D9Z1A8_9HYPH|nr:hypothetical protein [Methylovirgula ligni]QAY97050.1 hypothetical protein CWB41_15985 [Methylovirgula ligni]REF87878.1 hypothetical protein DES32_1512 [Methylovirgula ligni]
MRKLPVILCALSCWSAFGTPLAAAEDAAGKDTTIHTTILVRSKASECPSGFTIFQMDSGKKLPPGPKICFVRAAKPAAK